AGKLRTRNSFCVREASIGNERANVTIIVRAFAYGEADGPVGCHRRPRNSRRFNILDHFPVRRINSIHSPQIARPHPQQRRLGFPGQRLRRHCRRKQPSFYADHWKFHLVQSTSFRNNGYATTSELADFSSLVVSASPLSTRRACEDSLRARALVQAPTPAVVPSLQTDCPEGPDS